MSRHRARSLTTFGLILLALLFGTGQAIEVIHPIEEAPHEGHHRHAGVYFEPQLPCDAGHDSHACIHSQKLAPETIDLRPHCAERVGRRALEHYRDISCPSLPFCQLRAPPRAAV